MFAVSENSKVINGVKVQTFGRNVKHVNTEMEAEAGSTGFRGYGPRENSARAYLSLVCNEGDFMFSPVTDEDDHVVGIEIACCGDGALMALADSLFFVRKAVMDSCDLVD